jgi:hypothetical protein
VIGLLNSKIFSVEFSVGCCAAEFDATYPFRLHGVFSQEDFRESLQNINESFYSRKIKRCAISWTIVCMLIGMILFLQGLVFLFGEIWRNDLDGKDFFINASLIVGGLLICLLLPIIVQVR